MPLSAGLRVQALLAPRFSVTGEEHPVMQPERPLLPELDTIWPAPESRTNWPGAVRR